MDAIDARRVRLVCLAGVLLAPLAAACSSDAADVNAPTETAAAGGGSGGEPTQGSGGAGTGGSEPPGTGGAPSTDASGTGGAGGERTPDAAANDAPLRSDAGGLETIDVAASGSASKTTTSLDSGRIYVLRASGTVTAGNDQLDAEYAGFAAGTATDQSGNLDVGVAVDEAANANPRANKWFGPYRTDHVYHMLVTGKGAPLSLRFVGPASTSGTIAVTLIALPLAGDAGLIETVSVPSMKVVAPTTAMSATSSVYLLQASGSPKVGGLALGQGDAEFCDYDATPTGGHPIDTENNIDLGIGVDELTLGLGLRKRKWGPYRSDHVYYQLFAGTGQPISFLYHDNGYGDNTTAFTVKMYAAP
jgi:hypothetical protein